MAEGQAATEEAVEVLASEPLEASKSRKAQKASKELEVQEAAKQERKPRTQEDRNAEMRAQPWHPVTTVPEVEGRPGWAHHWVRVTVLGKPDNKNASKRFREGWEPCERKDYPEFELVLGDHGSSWEKRGGIEVGGLLLCKMSSKKVAERNAYFAKKSSDQLQAVDSQLMGTHDSASNMQIMQPNRRTDTTFGGGGG